MEQMRHAEERGAVLRTLAQDYEREMTSVRSLAGALDLQGYPLSDQSLQFHLTYLSQENYVQIWRAKDTAAWRRDRGFQGSGDNIVFAKLLVRGLHLLDGRIGEDPGVRF